MSRVHFFHGAADFIDVEESFPAFRIFRFFSLRRHFLPFKQWKWHSPFSLGITGMDAPSTDGDYRIGGIEIFIFQSSQFSTIHGISEISTEGLHQISRARPVSSSGVKAMRILPCFTSGCCDRYSMALTMAVTPALSSDQGAWYHR